MKINTFLFKKLWVLIIFLITAYAQGMLLTSQQSATDAQFHNQNQVVMSLPHEILAHIFSFCCPKDVEEKQLLHTFFMHCTVLKKVCKHFNNILASSKIIGQLCEGHTLENKNKVLQQVVRMISRSTYFVFRPTVFSLLYSGASADIGKHSTYNTRYNDILYVNFSLLHKALIQEDIDLFKLLLDLNADPHQLHPNKGPLFFFAKNIAFADLFLKKGVDVNTKDKDKNNVLWYLHQLSLELIQFYIDHGVDMRYTNPIDGTCILHVLASPTFKNIYNSNDFYKKGVLLIKTIPDMVNTLHKKGKTPIDLMEEKTRREFYKNSTFYAKPFKELIAVYRNYNGKTAQELTQEK